MEKNIAIIFAGGTGQRFGSEIPKQFVRVYGKQIIIHTLEVFEQHPEIDEIYVGCIADWIPYLKELVEYYGITKIPEGGIIPGGTSGQDTIYQILKKAREKNTDNDIVLIHDGVRPIVTAREISENIQSVKTNGSAVTCIPFSETPVFSRDGKKISATLSRKQLFRGVAPQSFRLGYILSAHDKIRATDIDYAKTYKGGNIVDSASLIRAAFEEPCAIVEGNPNNMKVTTTGDFFALLGIMQKNDVENYLYSLNNPDFELNSAMREAQRQSDDEKKKKIGSIHDKK